MYDGRNFPGEEIILETLSKFYSTSPLKIHEVLPFYVFFFRGVNGS